MASPVITPEDVLETLMNDGTMDAIRAKIINQLKANEELKNNTIAMVEQSKVLNTPGAEKQTKRELFDSLKKELEIPVQEKASKAVWELILDERGLGKEISGIVERVFARLSGLELPGPSTQTAIVALLDENREKEETKNSKEAENPKSRKRRLEETSTQNDAEAVANNGYVDQLAVAPGTSAVTDTSKK